MKDIGRITIEFVEGETECNACGKWSKGRFIRGESKFPGKPGGRQTMCLPCGRTIVGQMLDALLAPPKPPSMLHPERN